jgi:hypothetical protein
MFTELYKQCAQPANADPIGSGALPWLLDELASIQVRYSQLQVDGSESRRKADLSAASENGVNAVRPLRFPPPHTY